jgi:hypothetical protein
MQCDTGLTIGCSGPCVKRANEMGSLLYLALTYEHSGVVGTWALASYDVFCLRGTGGVSSRAGKVNEHVLLCPLLQRCDAQSVLHHLQLLLVLLRGDAGPPAWHADAGLLWVRGTGKR